MKQLTKEEAIQFAESRQWETMSLEQRALFQMEQDLLCMPFNIFHEAVQKTLNRPVFTHEFGLNRDGLLQELRGLVPAPSMWEVLDLLPPEKTLVVIK